jgi:hypothetical protein
LFKTTTAPQQAAARKARPTQTRKAAEISLTSGTDARDRDSTAFGVARRELRPKVAGDSGRRAL